MYIPDPLELLESRIEREIAKIDEHGTYPCCVCERRDTLEHMAPIDSRPDSPLQCDRPDCYPPSKSDSLTSEDSGS